MPDLLLVAGIVILLMWALGFVTSYTLGGSIHFLLLLALIIIVLRYLKKKRRK